MGRTPREFLRMIAQAAATALVSPLFLAFWVQGRLLGRDRALQNVTQALALLPGLTGQYLRRGFLVHALDHCHHSVMVEFGTTFSRAGARLDENVYIGPMCHIGLAHLGRDTLVGAGVHIPSGPRTHGEEDLSRPIRDQAGSRVLVRVGAGAWIGSAAVVMADVGPGAIVGAGAVVTRPIPERTVAVGVPARVVRSRGREAIP